MSKPSVPAAPDYTPFITASKDTAAADQYSADLQYKLGKETLDKQDLYAQKSADLGDKYFTMADDAAKWGRDQYDTIFPYAKDYLAAETATSTESNKEARDTYNRYLNTYVPKEDQYTTEAFDYASPARAAEAAGAAKADVATSYGATADAAKRSLMSYGIDPSQGRFAALADVGNYQQAAASAAAGTTSRLNTDIYGRGLEQNAIEIGQKLPALALNQTAAGTSTGASGIGSANSTVNTGVTSGGSPTSYAALSNPYTNLAGSYGSLGSSLYGSGTNALGNASSALSVGAGALNSGFSNQMSSYNAKYAQSSDLWGGIGKLAGAGITGAFSLSDRRLKEGIETIGRVGRLPLHAFRYRDDPTRTRHVGFMADEVEKIDPGAVRTVALPFKAVDYRRAVTAALA